MKRLEIIQASQKILDALSKIDILEGLEQTLREGRIEKEAFNAALMSKLHQYSLIAKDYGPIEKQISRILGLADFTESDKWPEVVYLKEGINETIVRWRQNLYFAQTYLPSFLELIEPDYFAIAMLEPQKLPDEYKGKALLTTTLIEDSNHPPTTDRVIDLISSVSSLYEVSSKILDHPISPPIIIGCDSGGEKSFDFLGASTIIEMVKEIILSLWDRIVFFRERQMSQRVELVAEALPVIEKIGELEKDKKIGREEAELLRRNIVKSVQKFISCGAVIPEMQERSTFEPHELMMPEPKLLEEGKTENSEEQKNN